MRDYTRVYIAIILSMIWIGVSRSCTELQDIHTELQDIHLTLIEIEGSLNEQLLYMGDDYIEELKDAI